MLLLVLNCGSATVKHRIFSLARQGVPEPGQGGTVEVPKSYRQAVVRILDELRTPPDAVAHRVVHGGPRSRDLVRLDGSVEREIRRWADLAPLHNERVWARGYGVVRHAPKTRALVRGLAAAFPRTGDGVPFWDLLAAADRFTSAAMWLAVHDSYAKNVYLDGRPLAEADFKEKPEGHTGSSLNIVPAYVGYLLANAISGQRLQGWLAVPLVLTSHTYENGKNEQSHQDPALCESLLGEALGTTRVLFVPDANTAAAVMGSLYNFRGQFWAIVVPKQKIPVVFDDAAAERLVREGAVAVRSSSRPRLLLAAIGAYQLRQALRASDRLRERELEHSLAYLLEPKRFAESSDSEDGDLVAPDDRRRELFPPGVGPRVFVSHPRGSVVRGLLSPLDTGARSRFLGYRNLGGTYDVNGMLFANGQSWLHVLEEAVGLLGLPEADLLSPEEREVLAGRLSPERVAF